MNSNYPPQPPVFYKNPGLAAVFSFFYMGLGQIYNGQIAKGIAFIVMYTISWVLMFILIGFITTPILFIYGMWDAYSSAQKINQRIAYESSAGGTRQPGPGVS